MSHICPKILQSLVSVRATGWPGTYFVVVFLLLVCRDDMDLLRWLFSQRLELCSIDDIEVVLLDRHLDRDFVFIVRVRLDYT
jgi:hypothetical protein